MFTYAKLQLGCLLIVLYIAMVYYKECSRTKYKYKHSIFDGIVIVTTITLIFDAITAVIVNYIDYVSPWFNTFAHMVFFVGIDAFIFAIYLYLLEITDGFPKGLKDRLKLHTPFIVNVLIVVLTMNRLEYVENPISNYSMGFPVYACYLMAIIYFFMALSTLIRRRTYIERHKRSAIIVYLSVLAVTTLYQMLVPEALITSVAFTVILIGMYINQQNPAINELAHYHQEMVMGFATLVEQRDDSTGGHVRRTSMYAELLANELKKRGYYSNVLTKDYIKNLTLAAPMHDIGKIAVPDDILQKPGKLTEEEFTVMKTHSAKGGQIILDTFGKLDNEEYVEMAYQVATYHHEKWNGCGYPNGLKEDEIPLCSRIMAVADVFDALSEKRCYRDEMPLEKCFNIIKEERGTHFDPLLVDVFLEIREKVEKVHSRV